MAERTKAEQPSLLSELQAKLKFEPDSTNEWLINDEFVNVGGVEHFEWLPARTRVSADGTRFEIGARIEDLGGLLALAKIVQPKAQGVDRVISFWKNHSKFSAKVEGEWVFIGMDLEHTTEDFEREYGPLNSAWSLALTSAIEDRTVEELKEDKWHKGRLERAENPSKNGRSILFDRGFIDRIREASTQCEPETEREVTVNTLREFPLDTYKTSIDFAPGTLIRDGKEKELDGISVQAYNGKPEVFIWDLDSRYDWEKKKWIRDSLRLILPVPGDLKLSTVSDLEQLSFTKLEDDNFDVAREMNVSITVRMIPLKLSLKMVLFHLR